MKHPMPAKPKEAEENISVSIVRIAGTDIPSETSIYNGLTKIKGISWSISNAVCHKLKLDRNRRINTLSEQEINSILKLLSSAEIPAHLANRRKDIDSGQNNHLITTDLDLARDFDVRRTKKTRSYKGWRHAIGQPVRGQRTKSHFRKGRAIGVQRSKSKPATSAKGKVK